MRTHHPKDGNRDGLLGGLTQVLVWRVVRVGIKARAWNPCQQFRLDAHVLGVRGAVQPDSRHIRRDVTANTHGKLLQDVIDFCVVGVGSVVELIVGSARRDASKPSEFRLDAKRGRSRVRCSNLSSVARGRQRPEVPKEVLELSVVEPSARAD